MSDLNHAFGTDLVLGPGGDLSLVSGTVEGEQRVVRRLLTNPGAYIWQLNYGAGLGAFVGQPNPGTRIQAVARAQMQREAAVALSPPPVTTVTTTPGGSVTLTVAYVDAVSTTPVTLTVPVS